MNITRDVGPSVTPWYRQLWPWLVMAPPAVAVVAGFVTLYLAGSVPAMVVRDYGRIGADSQQEYRRDRQATNLGLTARLTLTPVPGGGPGEVTIVLDESAAGRLPDVLELAFLHPTLEKLDRRTKLAAAGDGSYRGRMEHLPGRYYVQVTDLDQSWRLAGEIEPGSSAVTLVARTPAAAEVGP